MRERLAALASAAVMLMCAAGCGSSGNEPAQTTASQADSQAETKAPVKVTLPPKTTAGADSTADTESKAPVEENIGAELEYKPAMWKATSPDGKEMYMMGSMHALNDTCYPLPDYVSAAYDEADTLAVECDISDKMNSAGSQLKYASKLTYPEGESIEDHISEETWDSLISYLDYYDIKPEKYEDTRPWAVYSALQTFALENTDLKADKGLDRFLLDSAHRDGKEIYEVESYDSQMSMLIGFSDELYDMLLATYSAETADALREQNIDLFKAWKTGDTEWVQNALAGEKSPAVTEEQKKIYEDFNKTMYDDRNAHMAKDAEELLSRDTKTFYVVGLAHFLGDKGIISLLEKDGYKVERVA